MADARTKTEPCDSAVLRGLVSAPMQCTKIEQEVFATLKEQHAKLLRSCLGCLQHHVWSDGSPMKNRARHCYKIVGGRTRIRAE